MKEFIEKTKALRDLSDYCKQNTTLESTVLSQRRSKKVSSGRFEAKISQEQQDFTEKKSALVIQRFWRASKMKRSLAQDSYRFFTSLTNSEDSLPNLSNIMFDLHIAELSIFCKVNSNNPLANQNGGYHRQYVTSEKLLVKLLECFQITQDQIEQNIYFPVSLLANSPIESIISQYHQQPIPPFTVLKTSSHSIGLVMMHKDNPYVTQMKITLAAAGVIASLWEIAQNIARQKSVKDDTRQATSFAAYLPTTKEKLLKSTYFGRLRLIAESPRHPTRLLATCLCKLLQNAPELSSTATCRIALMLEITLQFYAHNYSKFAFCVYAVVHDISLLLVTQTSADIEQLYSDFYKESEDTLLKCLDVQKEQLTNHFFFTAPSISGANAFIIAMQVAKKMHTGSQAPTIKIIKPSYYEFDFITESTTDSNPDIYVFCAGPIVNQTGLIPGIDVNRFIRNHVLSNPDHKPVTLVIDATTALYKNLRLDPDVKELIKKGLLTIIIHESHQKFGLLHTDQAQYGRTSALCSNRSFTACDLTEIQSNTKFDFFNHVDMRIGAFINVVCTEYLEKIKEQHFKNGSSWGTPSVALNEDMLPNLNELYFFSGTSFLLKSSTAKSVQPRDSFGHYLTTSSLIGEHVRISPDASDILDTLPQAAKLSITLNYSGIELENIIIKHGQSSNPLDLEHQIICLAILHNIAQNNSPNELCLKIEKATEASLKKIDEIAYNRYKETVESNKKQLEYFSLTNEPDMVEVELLQDEIQFYEECIADYKKKPLKKIQLLAAMRSTLQQCSLLTGRYLYMGVESYLTELRQEILEEHHPQNASLFFKAVSILYEQNTSITLDLVEQLKSNQLFCKSIIEHPDEWKQRLQATNGTNTLGCP